MPNISNNHSRYSHQSSTRATHTKKAAGASDNSGNNISSDNQLSPGSSTSSGPPGPPNVNGLVIENFIGSGGEISYSPENLKAYFMPHHISIVGNDSTANVSTGSLNDRVYLGTPVGVPFGVPGGGSVGASDNNTWTVDTLAGSDLVHVGTGNNNVANVDLGNNDDTASVQMNGLTTSMSGNIYNLDGGQGEDTLRLGQLPPDFDFSTIKSKQQPDGSYQLIISPSNGGPDNIINVSNFESVHYNFTTLSFADFIARTTQI